MTNNNSEPKKTMTYTLAIDIGGTFTDIVLLQANTGRFAVAKVLTSYPDPSEAVLSGTRDLLRDQALEPDQISRTIHGTTLVTNALIERKGAKTALLTTRGFKDTLLISREGRYDIYDLNLVLPEPLVERRLRLEVAERSDSQGQVLTAMDAASLEPLVEQLKSEGVEAVAVTFLHAYANPDHEIAAGDYLRELMPDVAISLSHRVAPEWREYERTSTTAANAYVQPLTSTYLAHLESGLTSLGIQAPLHIMLSNAGTASVETAAAFPVRLVESGPSGGALAGGYWSEGSGFEEVLAFDMGGTTAKAIMSMGGEFPLTADAEVARVHRFKRGSGLPLLVPMLDMIEIGAGGGSIAQLNDLGLPTVGPESASSDPGPACYGLGGSEPTVTDADLLLGYLNPNYFVGGDIQLDPQQGAQAIQPLAESLGLDAEKMAWGIHDLVNENMAGAARVHAAERGIDIRKYAMVATGGAGPVHACGVAKKLRIRKVIIPPIAGVGSAFGLQLAPISFDFSRTRMMNLASLDVAILNGLLAELEQEGRTIVESADIEPDQVEVRRSAEMRYQGQGFNLRVPVPPGSLDAESGRRLTQAFEAKYQTTYGITSKGVPIQAINWRVTVAGPAPKVKSPSWADHAVGNQPQKGTRPAIFSGTAQEVETPVYDRYSLPSGFAAQGPAIIEEAESTTVILPGWSFSVDMHGSIVLEVSP